MSIIFLLLANVFLLANAIVPHHHHDSMPVAVLDSHGHHHDHHDHDSHHQDHDSHHNNASHHHDGPETCLISQAEAGAVVRHGDYIMNSPEDIQSTGFWQMVLNQCRDFAEHYNQDGGNATVIYLLDQSVHGNSHFMFQEENNAEIADLIFSWLKEHSL